MRIFNKIAQFLLPKDELIQEFETILKTAFSELKATNNQFWNIKMNDLPSYTNDIKAWSGDKKIQFIEFLVPKVSQFNNKRNYEFYGDSHHQNILQTQLIENILKSTLDLQDENLQMLFVAFKEHKFNLNQEITGWPIQAFIRQVEHHCQSKPISPLLERVMQDCKAELELIKNYSIEKQTIKLIERVDQILYQAKAPDTKLKPTFFLGKDDFGTFANQYIVELQEDEKSHWYQLIAIAQKSSGSKPSKKYLEEAKVLMSELGHEKFKRTIYSWIEHILQLKEKATETHHVYNGETYTYRAYEFISSVNIDCLKGFIWMCAAFHDQKTITLISKLAERCYKKIPEKGPAAAALGNACLYSLYTSKGLDGIAQLSRLKLRIKQNNTISIIEKYIVQAAEKRGISMTEIEDIAVDDYKIVDDKRMFEFPPFTCQLVLLGIGKSELKWFKENGEQQKSVPTVVKENYAPLLKKVKDIQKQIDLTTSAQKERFDRMLRSNRVMSMSYFIETYLQHPIFAFVLKKVIFCFTNQDKQQIGIQWKGAWVDKEEQPISIEQYNTVSLWHPASSSTNEVKEWRNFLISKQLQQPFKQAFREIYLLTEAEINTRTYSNRMASHILKQHQYVNLAKGRNWNAKLIGSWDGGDNDTAKLNLPEYGLRAEYWVDALNADDAFNEIGIWNYVTTDQIRFVNTLTEDVVELIDVPPILFSEVLRDVDLFVGVASVGNDPTWQDSGGLPTYRDYWQSYSFGDLSEIAKNRKEILSRLIPRLKIASVTTLIDKFVVVKGKLRTYKIHIGSTNILMEPNDQYLCIVPDRSKKNEADQVFLPFEGDNGLSVILSKAILLANDDKITDSTITSQINR